MESYDVGFAGFTIGRIAISFSCDATNDADVESVVDPTEQSCTGIVLECSQAAKQRIAGRVARLIHAAIKHPIALRSRSPGRQTGIVSCT